MKNELSSCVERDAMKEFDKAPVPVSSGVQKGRHCNRPFVVFVIGTEKKEFWQRLRGEAEGEYMKLDSMLVFPLDKVSFVVEEIHQ